MEKSKIETYLGFCIRARKIVFGAEEVEQKKKGVFLIIADESLGTSSQKLVAKAQEKFACPLIKATAGTLGERLHRIGVKTVAITDKNLALAIVGETANDTQFKLYSGGTN
ncbi:MAG: hypothetical protein IJB34_05750 [Clostridia bacterium]|nr:hypothetical protein [Clostridia bacterium]